MPVSRRRKKKPSRSGRPPVRSSAGTSLSEHRAAPIAWGRDTQQAVNDLFAYRQRLDELRAARATSLAADLVVDLVSAMTDQPDLVATDALCGRLGAVLTRESDGAVEGQVDPNGLAEATLAAAEKSVAAALTAEPDDAWRGPWRVLAALDAILPAGFRDGLDEAITRLRASSGGTVLPARRSAPAVTGPVLWTSDGYGSRFAVTALITTADEGARWYLWDIDACGHQAFTVYSGYFSSAEDALANWRAAVGEPASAAAVLAPVDDPALLAELLPVELGFMRPGGENAAQLAEYHRSQWLGERVLRATPRTATRSSARSGVGLTPAAAAAEFTTWLSRDGGPERSENLDELVAELADSWNINGIDAIYATCSPHRVAACALHMRNYYQDDFAEELTSLLPPWTRWLATRNGTAPGLADRCTPYAEGRPHPQLGDDDTKVDYQIRVVE